MNIHHRSTQFQPRVTVKVDVTEAQRLRDQGLPYRQVAKRLGTSYGTLYRALKQVTPNGTQPSQRIAVHRDEMADLRARVATLEAFMAAMQAEHRSLLQPIASQPIAIHRSEPIAWLSRGVQLAPDMLEALDRYAAVQRLEKREVLDLALRTFFAHGEGEGGRADG